MKVLFILNYYYPYVSGVTETIRMLAEKLAKDKKYQITVLCSNHDKLKEQETIHGVRVIRAPIIMKISKGTVSPSFIWKARKLAKEFDVVNVVSPMLEAGIITKLIDPKKIILTYHCDMNLPPSLLNNFIVKVMDISHKMAFKRSPRIIVSSIDYAKSSRVLTKYLNKCIEIAPLFKEKEKVNCQKIPHSIGFCGRIVEEKGIDVLIKAFVLVKKKLPDAKLRIAGDYQNVAGGSVYPSLKEYIERNHISDITFLGKVKEEELAKFYSELEVFTLPSINSLEAFGLVQIEAMQCGVPVVASDLPGVRTIVNNTGFGLITKRNDEKDLANKLLTILKNPEKYKVNQSKLKKIYTNDILVKKYEDIFNEICKQ